MQTPVFEMCLPACVNAAELAGMLSGPEFLGAWEAEGAVVLYWTSQGREIQLQVRAAVKAFGVAVSEAALQLRPVIAQDWNAEWAASVQPVRIGRRIGIRPSWASMDLPEDGIELIIDPKQAFGTGHHATTHMMLEYLGEMTWRPQMRVLDVGTGSGILAMAALRLGAAGAMGIDVDATALGHAREYAALNQFDEALDLRCCPIEAIPDQPFDIILANLDCRTFLQMHKELIRMRGPRTQLMVSGLLEEDQAEMMHHFVADGWMCLNIRRQEGWLAIQFEGAFPPASSSSG